MALLNILRKVSLPMATALQDKEIFQQENDQLLKNLLDMRFFSVWRERDKQLMRPDFD